MPRDDTSVSVGLYRETESNISGVFAPPLHQEASYERSFQLK